MGFEIGRNLRILRAARGVTQAAVARQVGVPHSTYAAFERGDRPQALNEEQLQQLANYFGVPLAQLYKKVAEYEEPSAEPELVPGMPLRVTLVGLGRINLGAMGPLFHRAGFELCGVNLVHGVHGRAQPVVEALSQHGHYVVREIDGRPENRRDLYVPMRRVHLFDDEDPAWQESVNACKLAARSHVIVSGVGTDPAAQAKCARFLLAVLRKRMSDEGGLRGTVPVDICGCENPVGRAFATALLRNRLFDLIAEDDSGDGLFRHVREYVRFPLLLADRICSTRAVEPQSPLTVVTEPEPHGMLRATENGRYLRHVAQALPGGVCLLSTDIEPFRRLKLHLLSCAHALAAYVGHLHGCRWIHEAVRKAPVRNLIETALDQAGEALCRRGGLSEDVIWSYRSRILPRLANPLDDPIARVARDPLRKLHRGDRLTGTALLVLYNCATLSTALAKGIAAALAYAYTYEASAEGDGHHDDYQDAAALQRKLWFPETTRENAVKAASAAAADGTNVNRGTGAVENALKAVETVLEQDCGLRLRAHGAERGGAEQGQEGSAARGSRAPGEPVSQDDHGGRQDAKHAEVLAPSAADGTPDPIRWVSEAEVAPNLETLLVKEVKEYFRQYLPWAARVAGWQTPETQLASNSGS